MTSNLEDMMPSIKDLKVKLFMDGADFETMKNFYKGGLIKGFTTNPSLMRKAGVTNYEQFAKAVLAAIPDRPISFEVFSDDFETMELEARKIASWGKSHYVKIPVTNTRGESSAPLVKQLSGDGLCLNVTAILCLDQVETMARALNPKIPSVVSVFAGRIADTGRDPAPLMRKSVEILKSNPKAEVLWASTRELLNIFQAEECGCHIITVAPDILKKFELVGKDLGELSLDTVRQFYHDAQSAGFNLVGKTAQVK